MKPSVKAQYHEYAFKCLYGEHGEQDDRVNVYVCVFACGTAMYVCVHFLSSHCNNCEMKKKKHRSQEIK